MIAFVFLIFAVTFSNAAYGVPAPTETAAPVPVETPKPAEPIVPQPETCKVKPGRSQEECQTASEQDDTCEKCATTACLACRTLYNKLCTQPEVFASAQECLNKYAETASAPGHSDEETRGRCRKGIAKLCAEQVCVPAAVETPKPAYGGPAPAQPETCKIQAGRSKEVCQAESEQDDICQKCGTSACGKCRSLYVQLCTKPEIFTSAQECLNKYAETATAPGHSDEDTRGRCRKGLAKLCASQVCSTKPAAYVRPPKVFAPRPTCPPLKPIEDITVSVNPPKSHLVHGREIFDGFRKLSKSLELLAYGLKLKGVTVDAPCLDKLPTINTQPLEWPVTKHVYLTTTTEATTTTKAPQYTRGKEPCESTPAPCAGTATDTPREGESEADAFFRYACKHQPSKFNCEKAYRDSTIAASPEAAAKAKSYQIAVIAHGVAKDKLIQVQTATKSLEIEIEAAGLYGKPAEVEELKNRVAEVEKLAAVVTAKVAEAAKTAESFKQ